jgi:hypothetical protein
MQYQPIAAPVRPFHEDENGYWFRFFCDRDLSAPIERNLPKSNPFHFCPCGVVIGVEADSEGPCLRFSTRPESHLAARLIQSFETLRRTSVATVTEQEGPCLEEQMKRDHNPGTSANAKILRYALSALGALVVFDVLIFFVHMMS